MSTGFPAALPLPSERPHRRLAARLIYRTLTGPIRFFAAPDVFITYSRRDGSAYAEALANHLAGQRPRISCFIDQWHGDPGRRIPAGTLRTARWSRALIVLATREALQSRSVDAEIREFTKLPGPIVLVVFPGVPVEDALWHERVAGIAPAMEPGGEQALAQGSPSTPVLRRILTSLTFWRRNRRIAWAAGGGTAVVAALWILASLAAQRASRMTRLSNAMELAMRAEDRLANDPSQAEDALRLGVQSLASTRTAWGESIVRRGLMLLPTFVGTVPVERRGNAAFGPGGVLAQWYRDEARSEAVGRTVSHVALIDPGRGTFVRRPVEVRGFVRNVSFATDGTGIVAAVGPEAYGRVDSVYWIARGAGDSRRFEVNPAGAFALDPAGGALVVANGSVERWTLGPRPERTAEWKLPGVRALAFSPDGSRLFALRSDRIVSLDPRDPGAPVVTLARVAGVADATLLATEGHVVLAGDSIRTWSLAGARWDHAFEAGTHQAAVAGDRLAVWSRWGATIWDLAATGVDLYASAIHADCETGEARAALLGVALSADGRRAALACGDGTAKVVSTTDGTLLGVAPVAGAVPRALHLDDRGSGLLLYATSAATSGPVPRARIASWRVVNGSSDRIGPGMVRAFALDARGGSLAAVFAGSARSAYGLAVFDPLTGRESARADTALGGWSFRVAFDAGRVAVANEREVSLWSLASGRLRPEGAFGVENAISLQFGGRDATHLAVSSARGDSVVVTVLERGAEGWRRRPPIRAASWTMPGMPDPVELAPVAVSGAGWIARLVDGPGPPGSRVAVVRGADAPVTLPHGDAVTLLRFTDAGRLLVATRAGEIWLWALDAPKPAGRRIGRHQSPVLALVAGEHDRVIAIDRDNVLRMWALGTPDGDVGRRGYMEFTLNTLGIWSYDALGARALGFSGERLVAVNRHARGLFADSWILPRQERLAAAVAERLGGPPR
jgi:hypothetical protein